MDDDWEECDLIIPNLEQSKALADRKLVEESDNLLTDELFNGTNDEKIAPKKETKAKKDKKPKVLKDPEEVLESKIIRASKKLLKKNTKRENDIFGEPIYDDEYAEYENKFYG